MPLAAVPAYIGGDFSDASPALRFGLYHELWGINRRTKQPMWTTYDVDYEIRGPERRECEVKIENKTHALRESAKLSRRDKVLMHALVRRLSECATGAPASSVLQLEAKAIAPFATGLGNEHPLENGFALLSPYGLPYLPGSGVKGVLRRAAQELASGQWGDTCGWSDDSIATITVDGRRVGLSVIDILFGREPVSGVCQHVRGVLSFWDVIPQIEGDRLLIEVMTPHQSHYYQQKLDEKSGKSVHPHESGQPNPISFLTVPPDSRFTFFVICDLVRLHKLQAGISMTVPLTAEEQGQPRWKKLLLAAFEHAFQWLGFGAKTAVGYGAMLLDKGALERTRQAERQAMERAKREAQLASLTPNQRKIAELQERLQQRRQELRGRKENWGQMLTNVVQSLVAQAKNESWSDAERRQFAQMLQQCLPQVIQIEWKDARKKLGIGEWVGAA